MRVTGRSIINETAFVFFHPLQELNAYVTVTNHNISYQLPARSLSTFLELLIPGALLIFQMGEPATQMADIKFNAELEAAQILTPEQRQIIQDKINEHKNRFKQPGK